ncbi:MAG: lipoyl synthase [Thermoanaerobaculia bacterium]
MVSAKLPPMSNPAPRLPEWIREKKISLRSLHELKTLFRSNSLHTVCESLACPNRSECFTRGTATFMILGDVCTRQCGFCNVEQGLPSTPPSPLEPHSVAVAAKKMNLRHVVITSVDRDDLPDGGAAHFAATIREVRALLPESTIEVLTPDFKGDRNSVEIVVEAAPQIFNHNVETVPSLYRHVRPGARFSRSLDVLRFAREVDPSILTKSGFMLGLGETRDDVISTMEKLREASCDILTIGQYLQPKKVKLEVVEYVHPDVFDEYRIRGEAMGFRAVFSGPFVRSSYMADLAADAAR